MQVRASKLIFVSKTLTQWDAIILMLAHFVTKTEHFQSVGCGWQTPMLVLLNYYVGNGNVTKNNAWCR